MALMFFRQFQFTPKIMNLKVLFVFHINLSRKVQCPWLTKKKAHFSRSGNLNEATKWKQVTLATPTGQFDVTFLISHIMPNLCPVLAVLSSPQIPFHRCSSSNRANYYGPVLVRGTRASLRLYSGNS